MSPAIAGLLGAPLGLHAASSGAGSYPRTHSNILPLPALRLPFATEDTTSGHLVAKSCVAFLDGASHSTIPAIPCPLLIADSAAGQASESKVQVNCQWKLERCRICKKICHRVAHCKTKSIFRLTGRTLLAPVAKHAKSAHNHPKADSAPIVMVSNQFEGLHFDEAGEIAMLNDVDGISRARIVGDSDQISHLNLFSTEVDKCSMEQEDLYTPSIFGSAPTNRSSAGQLVNSMHSFAVPAAIVVELS
ncbi:hypothetical protein Nepgr_027763 [Nepenthes gracilis]|uniref:Uncharacterized protein n=1 Tax=Nepenthes gracilis TaxID=150966 RepID=A0AAD3Y399_NEPGR|nr:hypothetical protein Nepgr_027763 [Nepenthes gracilis]